jgi:hypothetical protein
MSYEEAEQQYKLWTDEAGDIALWHKVSKAIAEARSKKVSLAVVETWTESEVTDACRVCRFIKENWLGVEASLQEYIFIGGSCSSRAKLTIRLK